MQVVITEEAEQSLDEIIDYLQKSWNQTVVNNFIDDINTTISRIQHFPNSFPPSAYVNAKRALISKQVVMLFRIENNTLIVLLFWDARQNPDKINL